MKTKMLFVIGGIVIPCLALSVLAYGQQPPVAERPVNRASGDQNEPAIAIDPVSGSNLMAGWNHAVLGGYKCGYSFSTDGGDSWQPSGLICGPGFAGAGDPSVAFDRYGNAYYCYVTWAANKENLTIYVSRTTDMGAEWFSHRPVSSGPHDDKPYIAVDRTGGSRDGNIYVSWTQTRVQSAIRFAYSTDHADTFVESGSSPLATAEGGSEILMVPGNNPAYPSFSFVHGSVPAVGPNGHIYVVWTYFEYQWDEENVWHTGSVKVRKSTDGGHSFGSTHTIANIPEAAFQNTFGSIRVASFPTIAVDPSNGSRIYVAYTVRNGDDLDVYFARSTNGGTSWSEAEAVTEYSAHKEFLPWLTVDSAGRVCLIYYTNRDDASMVDAYLAWSTNNGYSFVSPNLKVSQQSSDPSNASFGGDYIGITSKGTLVYPIWTDFRTDPTDKDANIYAAIVDFTPGNVRGYVKDSATGSAVANASVILYYSDGTYTGKSDYTNFFGYFEIGNIETGDYYLTIQKAGYVTERDPESGSFNVSAGETEDRGTIYLCKLGTVKGYVKEDGTGDAIENALARLYTSGGSFTGKQDYTNPDGYFDIVNISPGNYYLLISKSGYETERDPNSGSFNVACGDTKNRGTIYLTPDEISPPQNLSWYNDNNHPHLTWDPSSGPGLTGYNVYRNLGCGYVFIAFVPKPTTNYLDNGVDVYGGKFPPNYAYYYVTAVDPESDPSNTVAVPTNQVYKSTGSLVDSEYLLFQNYPNPFNPETEITYGLAEPSYVRLAVYNILGQEVRILIQGNSDAGVFSVLWDTRDGQGKEVPAGIYIYRLETGRFTATKRMLLLK